MEALYVGHNGSTRWGGGLNLRWNDFSVDNPVIADWLDEVHVGGEFEQCLSAQRQPLDPTVSGSWYHPLRSGEGVAAHLLDTGRPMLYWFTYDAEGRQRWLFEIGRAQSNAMTWPELLETRGRFGSGLAEDTAEQPAVETRGSLRLDRIDTDRMVAQRVMIEENSGICLSVYPPPLNCFGDSYSDRLEYQRLSQLAGTTCESGNEYDQYSGAWYNPERSGEGFVVEILPDKRIVVYWFTYQPDDSGQQAWMVGDGTFLSEEMAIDPPPPWEEQATLDMVQPVGAQFGNQFDAGDVHALDWGELTIEFDDEDYGHIYWDSDVEGYGSGDYEIERLAQPMLTECD